MGVLNVPLRLFLVDDEPAIRQGLADLFPWEDWGFVITGIFENGRQALNALRLRSADVVLTDIRMPVMDGLTLAQRIQEEGLPVHLVLLSAYADCEYAHRGLFYGVKDYIIKPVEYQVMEEPFLSLRRRLAAETQKAPLQPAVQDFLTEQITAYLQTHLADATLDGAAKIVGMNAKSFSRLYKSQTGTTFSQALHVARMNRARELVCNVSVRLFSIAQSLGYDNAKNFTRAFRSHFGMSPSAYRKKHAGNV